MIIRQDLTERDTNKLNVLVPQRDRIVGLPEKRQPHHNHINDQKNYLERLEPISKEILTQNMDSFKHLDKIIPSSKLRNSQKQAPYVTTDKYSKKKFNLEKEISKSTDYLSGAQNNLNSKTSQSIDVQQKNISMPVSEDFFPNTANINPEISLENKEADKNIIEKAKDIVEGGYEKLKNIFGSS